MGTNLEDLIMRDTRANQPAAGIAGRLYFVTDEDVMERDNGASWEDVSVSGSGLGESGWVAAGETWTYASADDPTFTFTIAGVDLTTKYSAGMRIKLTQTTAKYFIITKVAFSTDTTVTIYGGTDYDLANAAITSPFYSTVKAPAGFPLDPLKWTVTTTDTADRSQATPTQDVWYNLGSITISIPIGCWRVYYEVILWGSETSGTILRNLVTLSTANNSESTTSFTSAVQKTSPTGSIVIAAGLYRENHLNLASKTSYFLNAKTTTGAQDTLAFKGDQAPTIVRAVCAYL